MGDPIDNDRNRERGYSVFQERFLVGLEICFKKNYKTKLKLLDELNTLNA